MSHVRKRVKVETEWNCTSCGTKNPGRNLNCGNCNNPKEKAEKKENYRLPENLDAAIVTDEALLATFNAGANWSCPNCGSDQRRPDGNCSQCGAGNPEKPADEPTQDRGREWSPEPPAEPIPEPVTTHETVRADPYAASQRPFEPEFTPPNQAAGIVVVAGAVAGIVGFIGLLFFLFWPRDVVANVESVNWSYVATLHQRQVNAGEGWRKNEPSGTYGESCKTKKNGTKNCNPHDCNGKMKFDTCYDQCPRTGTEKCNKHDCNCHVDRSSCKEDGAGGADCDEVCDDCYDQCPRTGTDDCNPHDCNGRMVYETCYDQCDVFEDWCAYSYDTWPAIATKTTAGNTVETFWPDLSAAGNDQRLERSESYQVRFTDGTDHWKHVPDGLASFQCFRPGTRWNATVSIGGGISPIAPAEISAP